ncbi:DUF1707 domain-containing protein [Tessaracoccus sp. OH4464_COT-324]|uniref:DUF1707 SHOCT-like domain-containing protein n=1 Tax=Tessaracoccus sp. OH4464_COT-324 TaxID=2491059 RepID=UPI000F63805D|nr:DUF1707 domain-containing protein [Tessaracoccus sp. OH4464_COT-324]RRD47132.1 DUF1707 domain-containing protein [Tessaracoccus sp. OH4464_COT-324]
MPIGFSADPFVVRNASIRAGNADREEVARILGDAYADGKLSDDEYHERLESAFAIKLLGEVRPLVIDLGTPRELLSGKPDAAEHHQLSPRSRLKGVAKTARSGGAVKWGENWSTWLILFGLLNVLWGIQALSAWQLVYYWPIWLIAPTGFLLLPGTFFGGRNSERRRRSDELEPPRGRGR